MQSITKEQCDKFKSTPTVNPLTGRKIAIGKVTHAKLTKLCNTATTKPKPKSTKKTKNVYIPPLGPMMHWSIDGIYGNGQDQKNAYEFIKFLKHKYFELKENNVREISKSEILDYIEMSDDISHLHMGNNMSNYCIKLREEFKQLKKTMKLINDQPKHDVFEYNGRAVMEIRPSRTFNRKQVAFVYNFYIQKKESLESELAHKTNLAIPRSHVLGDQKRHKAYLDHLIKLNVFSYDDIYKHTFKNEKFPEELEALYKRYLDKYPSEK